MCDCITEVQGGLKHRCALHNCAQWIYNGCIYNGCIYNGWIYNGCIYNGCIYNGWIYNGCIYNGCIYNGWIYNGYKTSQVNLITINENTDSQKIGFLELMPFQAQRHQWG